MTWVGMVHLPAWSIVLPPLAAVTVFLVPKRAKAAVSMVVSFLMLALAACSCLYVLQHGPARYPLGGWGEPLGIELRLDGVSAIMLLLTAIVGGAVIMYAASYLRMKKDNASSLFFWPLTLFMLGGLNALFLSADIFNLYVALEVLTLSAVGLVALAGTIGAITAATRYLLLGLLGSLLYLFGVGILYSHYARLDMDALSELVQPDVATSAAVVLVTLGLLIKAALFPMHIWLPPAHAKAPAPVSALLSGLVVMAPFYLLVRLWFGVLANAVNVAASQVVGVLGCVAILWGALQALRQSRLKMVIAYSTVSQLGYMFLVFPLAFEQGDATAFAWNGCVYFALAHACAKASAFLAAGALLLALGHDRVDDLQGTAERYPLVVLAFGVAGVNLMGLPPSGGFVAKWMLIKAALISGQWWYAIVTVSGTLLAAAYVFRVIERTLPAGKPGEAWARIPIGLQVPVLGLALVAAGLGLLSAFPLSLFEFGAPAAAGPFELLPTGGGM